MNKLFVFPLFALLLLRASVFAGPEESVYIFGATWCPPCHRLERDISANTDGLNTELLKYKSVSHFDWDTDRLKLMTYSVTKVPTIIIVDKVGGQVRRMVGYSTPGPLLKFLRNER